jgi:hypothetical protein
MEKNSLSYNYNKGDLLMKKIVLSLVVVLSTALVSNAYVDNQYMTTEQFLVNVGYSGEMSNVMAITNQDPYREPAEKQPETRLDIAKKIYNYLIPATYTNFDFYNHSGDFNNPNWRDY